MFFECLLCRVFFYLSLLTFLFHDIGKPCLEQVTPAYKILNHASVHFLKLDVGSAYS